MSLIFLLRCPVLFCNCVFVKFVFDSRIINEIHVRLHFFIQLLLKIGLLQSHKYEVYLLLMFLNCVFQILMSVLLRICLVIVYMISVALMFVKSSL